mmetsp:Transcript_20541/g.59587  ORF Transcript_20541/g.59587 Transcript_20541/m.59587 type:complete len:113 (+) Transcript_20541:810-1148(+)
MPARTTTKACRRRERRAGGSKSTRKKGARRRGRGDGTGPCEERREGDDRRCRAASFGGTERAATAGGVGRCMIRACNTALRGSGRNEEAEEGGAGPGAAARPSARPSAETPS